MTCTCVRTLLARWFVPRESFTASQKRILRISMIKGISVQQSFNVNPPDPLDAQDPFHQQQFHSTRRTEPKRQIKLRRQARTPTIRSAPFPLPLIDGKIQSIPPGAGRTIRNPARTDTPNIRPDPRPSRSLPARRAYRDADDPNRATR